MAITTIDGALAGMQPLRTFAKVATPTPVAGRPQSLYPLAGVPGAGSYNGTLNGAAYSSSVTIPNGIIPHVDPGAGNAYLGRLMVLSNQIGELLLCDRLWDGQIAINNTSLQSITFPGLPSRDNAGTANGDGVMVAFEVSAVTSATAAALSTFTYTNQAGTGSRTGTFLDAPSGAAGQAGMFYRIALQAGDTGVRSIQSFTFSTAWTTGTVSLVAYRVLTSVPIVGALIPNFVDAITGGFPRLYNGVCPFLIFIANTASAITISGDYTETQG